jgi:hypothetical protein
MDQGMTIFPTGRRKINRTPPQQAQEPASPLRIGDTPGERLIAAAREMRAAFGPVPECVLAPDPFPPADPMAPETADRIDALLNELDKKERRSRGRA